MSIVLDNGADGWEIKKVGTVQHYILLEGNENEEARLDALEALVPGTYADLEAAFAAEVHGPTGKLYEEVFAQAIQIYDPADKDVLLASQLSPIVGAPAEADHNLLIDHINALKDIINDLHR